MTGGERAALLDLLERPSLRRLWTAARARLERYGALRGSVRLDDPEAGERRAVADLFGLRALPPAERPLRVTLAKLDRILRESRFGVGLKEAMELQVGKIRDLPAERAAEEDGWRRFWHETRHHPSISSHPELAAWLADVDRTGLYRRLSGKGSEDSATLMRRILAILAEVLGDDGADGVRLAVLASRALGDSHALDAGHRVPALVLRALARIHDRPLPATAADRRELWALAGVVCDDLSCDVLVLGLAPAGDELLLRTLRQHAAAGEPLRVTLR
ncbi:MAG: TIGR02679 domain-containing protein, partial [Thermoanaerobaculia bacterium]